MKSERIPVKSFSADNGFIGKMQKLVREEVLPYQYNILNDAIPGIEKSHAIENIRLAAEKLRGKDVKPDEFYGMVFQDSDVAKWIEAAAYALAAGEDPELEKAVDETIQLYGASQHEDGYVDSYFTVKCPDKMWTNICDAHELYCAGHMMEAAVAYYEVTGQQRAARHHVEEWRLHLRAIHEEKHACLPGPPGGGARTDASVARHGQRKV